VFLKVPVCVSESFRVCYRETVKMSRRDSFVHINSASEEALLPDGPFAYGTFTKHTDKVLHIKKSINPEEQVTVANVVLCVKVNSPCDLRG